jgi:hypothetical protein
LSRGRDTTLVLGSLVLPPGMHQLYAISRWPNGVSDEQPANDTLRQVLAVAGTANDPHQKDFEDGSLVSGGWACSPAAGGWSLTNGTAYGGTRAAWVNSYADTAQTGALALHSPVITPRAGADSLWLQFALATASRQVAAQWLSDTLEVWVTTDCSASRQLVYRRSGTQLASTGTSANTPFVPGAADWRQERVDLTSLLPQLSGGFQFIFRLARGGGNNLYLDEISLATKTIPPALKQAGFGVFPNPFQNAFTIWHLQPDAGWRSARLTDAAGRVVLQWQWSGNAPQTLTVPASGLPRGIYFIQLQYEGYSRTRKLLKW